MGGGGATTLAAIVFTDIVGSTELRSELGEDAADELRRGHEADLAAAVEGHQGRVVKTLGDGVMAMFTGVADAVSSAKEAQQATEVRGRRSPAGLSIRVGISAGDVVVEDGDCHGTPVIEAARLCDAAVGGQILCSAPVQWMSRGRGDHTFVPVGDLDLKGLPEPVPTLEVRWEPAAAPEGAPLPAALAGDPRFPFVGRDAERAALVTAWKQVDADGGRRVVLLAGEPGVGKTRLAGEAARAALAQGGVVLFGRCDEDLGVPYQPFAEALRQYVGGVTADDVAALGAHPGDLARVLPDLAEQFADLPPPLTSDPETERYRLFDGVASWLAEASTGGAVLLVLDDLHWAGKPTLLLLRHLIRSATDLRLLVVGTYRDTDLDRAHPLAEVLADLRREPAVERIALRGLDGEGVAAFLEAAGGHDLDERGEALAAAIAAETEGNPFFVGEVLAHLVESGALYEQDGRWTSDRSMDEMAIPEGVRDVVGRRLSRLSEAANDTLTRASVIGQVFELRVLVAVSDLDEDEVVAALEEAATAGLVRESDEVYGYRFAHALVRATLYEELPTARRVRLHRRVGEAIEAVHPARLDERAADLAHHFGEAAAGGDVDKAVDYARRAGRGAEAAAGWDQALDWYRRALELHEAEFGPGDSAERVDLLITLGRTELELGVPEHRERLLAAGNMAQRLADSERMARAALANNRGGYSSYGHVDQERVGALEAALSALGDEETPVRAQLLATLAGELTFAGDMARQTQLLDEAVAIARRLDDPSTLLRALSQRETAHDPLALDDRSSATAEAVSLADHVGDPSLRTFTRFTRAILLLERGDTQEYHRLVDETQAVADEIGLPRLRWGAANLRTGEHLLAGRLAEAEAEAERSREFALAAEQPEADLTYASALTVIRRAQGRSGEFVPLFEGLATTSPGGLLAVWAAGVLMDAGRPTEAEELLDAAPLSVLALTQENVPWPVALGAWAESAAPLGRIEESSALYEALAPIAGQVVVTAPGWPTGAVDHFLGMLAPVIGLADRVDTHFRAAEDLYERLGFPLLLSESQVEWGAAKLAAGDPDAARPHLEAAISLSEQHGFPGYERRATALLAQTS